MKKATFTCKTCGGEHRGLICDKFRKPPKPVAVKKAKGSKG